MKRILFAVALVAACMGLAKAAAPISRSVDIGQDDAVIELQDSLGPYKMPADAQPKANIASRA